MFDDLYVIDWQKFNLPDTPKWIVGLVSNDEFEREESFDFLKGSSIETRPDFAYSVIPYIIKIIINKNTMADIPVLLGFVRAQRINSYWCIEHNILPEFARDVIVLIDSAIDVYKALLFNTDDETQEAAQSLIKEING